MSTKEAREALLRIGTADECPADQYDVEAALDELDARRAADGDVRLLALFNVSRKKTASFAAKRLLARDWLKPCDGCSVTHNAGEGK